MQTGDLDPDVRAYILAVTRTTGETPSAMLRRILELPALNGGSPPKAASPIPKDARHRDLLSFVDGPELRASGVVTKKFLALLGFLYRQDPKAFELVLTLSGRHRKYLGRTKDEISKSGKSVHPRQVPGSTFWVMTNADTDQKQDLARKVLLVLGYERGTVDKVVQALA